MLFNFYVNKRYTAGYMYIKRTPKTEILVSNSQEFCGTSVTKVLKVVWSNSRVLR